MLGNLRKRFHAAKYLYTIQLQRVSPWFMHDKPVVIRWSRGNRRNRRGQTELKTPTKVAGNKDSAVLHIDESFDLDVTLYAEHSRTRKTGPYGRKELRLIIMAMDDAASAHAVLGALTIHLNEFNGLMNHEMKLPIECDAEIVNAVGAPHFYVNIRSWYKKSSGGTSISSGVTSTGWTNPEHSESDGEAEDLMLTHPDDPVKALEESMNSTPKITDNSINSLVTYSIDSVPENPEIEQKRGTSTTRDELVISPVEGLVEAKGDSEQKLDTKAVLETSQNHTVSHPIEIFKNEEQEDRIRNPDESEACHLEEISESSFKNTEPLEVPVSHLLKRLSTIKSEDENEETAAAELSDQTAQSPVKEIEVSEEKPLTFETTNEASDQITELQNPTNEDLDKKQDFDKNTENQNLVENEDFEEKTGKQYLDESTENQDLVKNEDPVEKTEKQYSDKNAEVQDLVRNEGIEENPQEQVIEKPEDDSEDMEEKLLAVSLTLDSLNEQETATLMTALSDDNNKEPPEEASENDKTDPKSINLVSYPITPIEQATTTTEDDSKAETPVKGEIEAEEEEVTSRKVEVVNPKTPVEVPVWLRWLYCVPGGRLLCCQPALPREP